MGDQGSRPLRIKRAATFVSRGLLLAGLLLLLAAASMWSYTFYAQLRWDRERAALSAQFVPAPALSDVTPAPPPVATQMPEATPSVPGMSAAEATPAATTGTASPVAIPESTPTAVATSVPLPLPTATADERSDPGRLFIPKLKVNAAIVTVPLINGLWDVSPLLYDVGLLVGTGWPGRAGNAAISGHVGLRGRGDGPFRWLERLVAGDEIFVDQGDTRYLYAVRDLRVVLPSDVSVVAPTEDATLTLITCTDWDFLKADYMKRLIVTATLTGKRRIGPQSQ